MKGQTFLGGAVLAIAITLNQPTLAEPEPTLADVERAYAEVDFQKTSQLARAALERGANDRRTTGRLYLLLATAAAAEGRSDEAREAFKRMLAAAPEWKLDRGLSPKIRAPYLEARGELGPDTGEAPLACQLRLESTQLVLTLRDSLGVAAGVELWTRPTDTGAFKLQRFDPRPELRVTAPPGKNLHYHLRVVDAHGNALFEHGSANAPARLGQNGGPPTAGAAASSVRASSTPYFVTAGTLGVLGLVAGAGATLSFIEREDAAEQWNGPGCERAGTTRAAQCSDVDDRRQRAELLAVGLTAGGGALLVGSFVALLLAPDSGAENRGLELRAGPGQLGLVYGGRL